MFNLKAPIGLQILIWCPLKMLPLKYPMGRKLISCVGKIMGKDHNNRKRKNPRFCAMDPKKKMVFPQLHIKGWSVEKIAINFKKFPIRCHFYNKLSHLIGDC